MMRRLRKVTLVERRRLVGLEPWTSAEGWPASTQPGSPEGAEDGDRGEGGALGHPLNALDHPARHCHSSCRAPLLVYTLQNAQCD